MGIKYTFNVFFSLYLINTFRPDELNIEVETLFIHVYEIVKLRDKNVRFSATNLNLPKNIILQIYNFLNKYINFAVCTYIHIYCNFIVAG